MANDKFNLQGTLEVGHEPCRKCQEIGADSSGDNLKCYSDGHKKCYACGYFIHKDSEIKEVITRLIEEPINKKTENWGVKGECEEILSRNLTLDTCRFFDIQMGIFKGYLGTGNHRRYLDNERVRIFNYYRDGEKVAQQIKSKDGLYTLLGNTTDLPFIGEHRYACTPNCFITITEGGEDMASVAQVMGLKYPVVSVSNGADSALKCCEINMKFLLGFKYVVLGLDNDESGKRATEKIVNSGIFPPGKLRLCQWKRKDANEMLIAKEFDEISSCVWNAKEYAPRYIVSVSDVIDEVLEQPKFGKCWKWRTMTEMTYGRKGGEIYVLVGAEKIGKTEITSDLIFHAIQTDIETKIGIFSFEHKPAKVIQRYVGKYLKQKLHLPDDKTLWDKEKIRLKAMEWDQRLFFYDRRGTADIKDLLLSMRYEAIAKGVKLFVIDNVKSLGFKKGSDNAKDFMNELSSLMKEVDADCFLVAHAEGGEIKQSTHVGFSSKVADPHGGLTEESIRNTMNKFKLDWGSGKMPSSANVDGGSAITALSDYTFAIARNKDSSDEKEKRLTRVRLINSRFDGLQGGKEFLLYFNNDGQYDEINIPKEENIIKQQNDSEEF